MTVNRKMERHLLYWICFGVSVLGICLIVLSFQIVMFSPEARAIGTTLCSIGIIGCIFQYYFQTSFENRVAEIIDELKESVIPEVARSALELGIRRIMSGRLEFDKVRLDLYDKAKNVLWVAKGVNLSVQYDMVNEILDRLKKGVNFRFLTWGGSSEIKDVIGRLMEIRNRKTGLGSVEIKVYKEEPRWYVQIIDDTIYAQPYLHGVGIYKAPMFELESGKELHEFFLRHAEIIWRDAKPVEEFLREMKKQTS